MVALVDEGEDQAQALRDEGEQKSIRVELKSRAKVETPVRLDTRGMIPVRPVEEAEKDLNNVSLKRLAGSVPVIPALPEMSMYDVKPPLLPEPRLLMQLTQEEGKELDSLFLDARNVLGQLPLAISGS